MMERHKQVLEAAVRHCGRSSESLGDNRKALESILLHLNPVFETDISRKTVTGEVQHVQCVMEGGIDERMSAQWDIQIDRVPHKIP